MNVLELIKILEKYPDKMEVAILDGFNGGGSPRTINLGPSLCDISDYDNISDFQTGDIETQTGKLIIMGYGCY